MKYPLDVCNGRDSGVATQTILVFLLAGLLLLAGCSQFTGEAAKPAVNEGTPVENENSEAATDRETETPTPENQTQLRIIGETGRADDGTLGAVDIRVAHRNGPINLSNATVNWHGPTGNYTIVSQSAPLEDADGRFTITPDIDTGDTAPVLSEPGDIFILTLDLGGHDVDPLNESAQFGQELESGARVIVTIETENAGTGTILVVPRNMQSESDSVFL